MEIYTLLHGWFTKQLMKWMQFVKQGNKIPISVCTFFFGGGAAQYSSSLVVSVCWSLVDRRTGHDKVNGSAVAAERRESPCWTSDCQKQKCETMHWNGCRVTSPVEG